MTVQCHPRRVREQTLRAAFIAVIGCFLLQTASARADEDGAAGAGRHVRSHNAIIVRTIDQASERSETFRNLVDIINAGNGIVYVEEGRCAGDMRACLVTVTPARPDHRIIHVRVDIRRGGMDLAGSIGHELHHATEILRYPSVTSGAAMFLLYSRIGYPITRGFETSGAVKAGNAVRKEIRGAFQKRGHLP